MTLIFVHIDANKPTLRSLMKYRDKIAPHWRHLGEQLMQEKFIYKLNIIKVNHPNNLEDCCYEMFQLWLEVDTEANWNKLIDALECMDLNATAAKIREDISMGKF